MDTQPIIVRLRAGNEQAFSELVDQFRDRVYNTTLGMLQNEANAEDVTQEVFIEIFRSVGKFRGDSELSTWIYRIAVQKALEHLRTSGRRKRSGRFLNLFNLEQQVAVPDEAPFYHPGILLENKERAAILFSAISKLPENQRTAFVLHKVEGLSQAEIAEIMKSTVSAVESLIVRAKQKLRELLSDYYDQNEQ